MSPHISYHPVGADVIERYVSYLSSHEPAGLAAIHYDGAGAHHRFRSAFVEMAGGAQRTAGTFDRGHGLNLAATQGFFDTFYYLHDARLSSMIQALGPYRQLWSELLPTWPATGTATNQLGDQPSSGVLLGANQVGPFMNAAHNDPELQAVLAREFPGDKLHVLWAALADAYGSGRALLEASGVIEPDRHDMTRSTSLTNQTNCDPTGLRLYLAG